MIGQVMVQLCHLAEGSKWCGGMATQGSAPKIGFVWKDIYFHRLVKCLLGWMGWALTPGPVAQLSLYYLRRGSMQTCLFPARWRHGAVHLAKEYVMDV